MKLQSAFLTILLIIPSFVFGQKSESWILTPGEARALLPNSLVLDTRSRSIFYREHINGSRWVSWEEFSVPNLPFRGNLLPFEILKKKLESYGVDNNQPVLVVSEPKNNWGEDGRIVWMLRYLGHRSAFLVDGGYAGLKNLGAPVSNQGEPKNKGSLSIKPDAKLTATSSEIKSNLKNRKYVFLDTREEREFLGETPYGESRGGHIPGAKHLYYKNLLHENGSILSSEEISEKIKELGIGRETIIVAYCTGGIRSAWVTTVLRNEGYTAKNYAGSMWEWSAGNEKDFPLTAK
ncbi:sulfurtransferase [Leptospira sp. 201903070]|uniref:Sulfurtransferase n=1 Tax=Leptospira ainlahdjerensis TaxID=2810033 RepID=A0ABS2UG77_9LEPT|nr:rhodanese-like domain-containing protein [Leptospira ainlahdjerensis]MBM9577880.1 sulfurtransferase [Leptospira ainlahdjerensis]